MPTAVNAMSLLAYRSTVKEIEQPQETRILDYIRTHGPSTIGEIAKALGMDKSTVSRIRCNPLRLPISQMRLI